MIQTNLLLATSGRTSDSFIMMDTMRLPLGILSGMGFIADIAPPAFLEQLARHTGVQKLSWRP
jgi:hypothetical protein